MHPIQRQILYQLITNPNLPYSKIKPKGIEGNLFMYHLKQLIQADLVYKRADGRYELTNQGKHFADSLSLETFKIRIQPKIVTLVACRNNEGEYLLYRRNRQPFLGLIGFPYGKIHLGETILGAALREFEEKTGLSTKITHRGEVYLTSYTNNEAPRADARDIFSFFGGIRRSSNSHSSSDLRPRFSAKADKLITQTLCHIFTGKNPQGLLKVKSEIGESFWDKIENIDKEQLVPGLLDVYHLVKNSSSELFFKEFIYHL